MNGLLKISNLVKEILTDIPDTRNSDSYLYLKVLERVAEKSETPLDLKKISVPYFLCNVKKLNCPYFETVSRTRRKIQEHHPELQGKPEVETVRNTKEKVFKGYALSKEG